MGNNVKWAWASVRKICWETAFRNKGFTKPALSFLPHKCIFVMRECLRSQKLKVFFNTGFQHFALVKMFLWPSFFLKQKNKKQNILLAWNWNRHLLTLFYHSRNLEAPSEIKLHTPTVHVLWFLLNLVQTLTWHSLLWKITTFALLDAISCQKKSLFWNHSF